jgi:lactoylglutathione lyase
MGRVAHIGIWVADLDASAAFYERWLGARIAEAYRNEAKGFSSRFLDFDSGARLELMRADAMEAAPDGGILGCPGPGIDHLAVVVGGEERVDSLYAEMRAAGVEGASAPRRTGDGYYEARVRDPDGVLIELCAEGRRA